MKQIISLLFTTLIAFFFSANNLAANDSIESYLLPQPKQLDVSEGKLAVLSGRIICPAITNPGVYKSAKKINETIEQLGFSLDMAAAAVKGEQPGIKLTIDSLIGHAQGYSMRIEETGISITGNDPEGLYYGVLTFAQIGEFVKKTGFFPLVSIIDWPDFDRRGVMLDISRDKVPTMQSLYELIDKLASWKINEIQLYTEHTFAYQNHKVVWENASPMTANQIIEIETYCKEKFIDLVPNQNSFGHMKKWLNHKEYRHLAEFPTPTEKQKSSSTLSPAEPGSLKLMEEIYDELLPNFASEYFNIGCDETFELGKGESKELCEQKGKGVVYLDFLLKLKGLADKHNKKVQFWGDIILEHPELIPQLPQDMVPLIWGYKPEFPYDTICPKFMELGNDYYVVPGTATWTSFVGRTNRALANLLNAAQNGKKYGAKGYLITDWGDYGHMQPLVVSYPSFLYGAALSWGVNRNEHIDIAHFLNQQVFFDHRRLMGQLVLNLGNAYLKTGIDYGNRSIFYYLLTQSIPSWMEDVSKDDLKQTISYIEQQISQLDSSQMHNKNANLIKDELNQAASLAIHACKLNVYSLEAKDGKLENITEKQKEELYNELKALITRHKMLWMERNRPGGLADSASKLEDKLGKYK